MDHADQIKKIVRFRAVYIYDEYHLPKDSFLNSSPEVAFLSSMKTNLWDSHEIGDRVLGPKQSENTVVG